MLRVRASAWLCPCFKVGGWYLWRIDLLNLIVFKLLSCIHVFSKMTFLSFLLSETNLKFKMALEVTHRYLQEESAMADFNGLYSYILTTIETLLS